MQNDVEKNKKNFLMEYFNNPERIVSKAVHEFKETLFDNFSNPLRKHSYYGFYEAYEELCGHDSRDCKTIDDFFCEKLVKALEYIYGKEKTEYIQTECEMVIEFPCYYSNYGQSYRSKHIGDYAYIFFGAMVGVLEFDYVGMELSEILSCTQKKKSIDFVEFENMSNEMLVSLINRIALELRASNTHIWALVEEAILGDNKRVTFTSIIIGGIIKSGDRKLLSLLKTLLLTAKNQEGLRESILGYSNHGSIETLNYFVQIVMENNLCRFSAVIRAFNTWTGLEFSSNDKKNVEEYMALIQVYMASEIKVGNFFDSRNVAETYFSLWTLACQDIRSATKEASDLLKSPKKYQRLTAWYFITRTNSERTRHRLAIEYLNVRDFEELAWILNSLYFDWLPSDDRYSFIKPNAKRKKFPNRVYPTTEEERLELFQKLEDVVEFIGKKNNRFTGSVFPWVDLKLNVTIACEVMLGLVAYEGSLTLIKKILNYLNVMSIEQRKNFYNIILNTEDVNQRSILIQGLSDKSSVVRNSALKRLEVSEMDDYDIKQLVIALNTNNSAIRNGIVGLLSKQKLDIARAALDTLLKSENKNRLVAGNNLLEALSITCPSLQESYQEEVSILTKSKVIDDNVSKVLGKISDNHPKGNEYNLENGYGLYDTLSDVFDCSAWAKKRPLISNLSSAELQKLIVPSEEDINGLFERIANVFMENANYEYETMDYGGTRKKVLLNSEMFVEPLAGTPYSKRNLIESYPLMEQWLFATQEFATNKERLVSLMSFFEDNYVDGKQKEWFTERYQGYPILGNKSGFVNNLFHRMDRKGVPARKIVAILSAICSGNKESVFDFAFSAYVNLIRKIPEEELSIEYLIRKSEHQQYYYYQHSDLECCVLSSRYLSYWRNLAKSNIETDEQFAAFFNEMWYEYLACKEVGFYGIEFDDIMRAFDMGLITEDVISYYLIAVKDAAKHVDAIAGNPRRMKELGVKFPKAKEVLDNTIDRIVSIEENRQELPTSLSNIALSITYFEGGIEHFLKLLVVLGDGNFYRGHLNYYSNTLYAGEISKKDMLSHLLRCCYPKKDDTALKLKEGLKIAKIPVKRLIQVAMYAPQWAGLIEKATDIPGLKCGVWFFHAHINEWFTSQKEAEISVYSPITSQEFAEGIFDKNWFYEAYNILGEKNFKELYKNAKYITTSSIKHRRSQLYADAVLGKLDKNELKKELIAKRNQEKLRAYALIPLDVNDRNDALSRYEFIQQFEKESRQFGSSRQPNEVKACAITLENLAITTGYGDVDRLTWVMEGEKIEQLRPLMEKQFINDLEVSLAIQSDGTPEIRINKDGKRLKTVPKEIARNSYITELKIAVKQLREQKRRARTSLENAMIACSNFTVDEVIGLLNHPILNPIVKALVFKTQTQLGFPSIDAGRLALVNPKGKSYTVSQDDRVTIAHAHDLISNKCWSTYQQYLFHNKIVQPFKQIFREYYPVTKDELSAVNSSRRYAGNQIQSRKAMALLKSRGWTINYEEGLQRVWHKHNLIVRIFALADWFTPADIEDPTIEEIQFIYRDSYDAVSFTEIPPVIFSEAMRDIDLVVSVAYAGEVDPETSQSTIEMRISIAKELFAMLKVDNITFQSEQTHHALIKGVFAEYSVHMGSGVVHKQGTGMISILPVHSQSRGKIFLPFADDDPKTAEIISKILLLANDTKIKDPSILEQINR